MPSLDMAKATSGTDYGDFRYQQIVYEHANAAEAGGETNPNTTGITNVEPLAGRGGLDTNEVAELVYFTLYAEVEAEYNSGEQALESGTQFRGAFGANIPADVEAMPNPDRAGDEPVTVIENKRGEASLDAFSDTNDNIFALFSLQGGPAFSANGPGGGQDNGHSFQEKHYRQITGRGPVLDANDNLSVISRLAMENSVIGEQGNVRIECIWDVAETDEAGRAFSVPDM